MSTKKLIPCAPIFLFLSLLPLSASSENLLESASFGGLAPGSDVGDPWKTKARGEQTAIRVQAPDGDASKDWVYVKDHDSAEKVYLLTDVAPLSKGMLSFRLYMPSGSATVGIYLRNESLDKDQYNIVEFKTLETSGNIYVGGNGQRQKLPVQALDSEFLSFDIEFDATDAGEKIDVYIKDTTGRHLIHSMTTPVANSIDTVMITTDTQTSYSEFYVGDISLSPINLN
ncbi:hypothetical protein [Cerasicoccus arenae]|uniref:Uncharacterized protein n=1 Tax=Cerasicoccus arenae TaxID=424488 RepID=A0A8J3D988_9BACT|nr:hypothetical protein [Cerasicoccus arenae]MBK1857954.1 hypothetical protein [Cerasicoccus arenae]GHB97845.1 hypothetical protein GCM10007047_12190 [Cerasicoccus arenae]